MVTVLQLQNSRAGDCVLATNLDVEHIAIGSENLPRRRPRSAVSLGGAPSRALQHDAQDVVI